MHLSNDQVTTIKAALAEAGLLHHYEDGNWDSLTQVGFDQYCLRFAPEFEWMVGKQPLNTEQVPPALLGETYAASIQTENTPIPDLVMNVGTEAAAEIQAESPQPEQTYEDPAPKLVEELGSVEAAVAETNGEAPAQAEGVNDLVEAAADAVAEVVEAVEDAVEAAEPEVAGEDEEKLVG